MTDPMSTTPLPSIDHARDGDRDFVLRKLDNHQFMRTGNQIIAACEMQIGFEDWKQNMADLWEEMKRFEDGRSGIANLFMIPKNGTVHIIFVTDGDHFDFDLADAIAELNIRFRREAAVWGDVEASQIPKRELHQFVPEESLRNALATSEMVLRKQ